MGRIQGEVSGLHGQLTALQGSWTGQASTSFQGVVSDWKATQHRVEESLAAIGHALDLTARHYAEVEQQAVQLFRR